MPLNPATEEDLKYNPIYLIYLLHIDPNFEIPMFGGEEQKLSDEDKSKSLKALQLVLQSEISSGEYQALKDWRMWNGGVKELRQLLIDPKDVIKAMPFPAQSSLRNFGESLLASHEHQNSEEEVRKHLITKIELRISELHSEISSKEFWKEDIAAAHEAKSKASEDDEALFSFPAPLRLIIRRSQIESCEEINKNITDAELQSLSEERFEELKGFMDSDLLSVIEQTAKPVIFLNFDTKQIKAAEEIGMALANPQDEKLRYFFHFADSTGSDKCGIEKLLNKEGLTDEQVDKNFGRIVQIAEIFVRTLDQPSITNESQIAGHAFNELLSMEKEKFTDLYARNIEQHSQANSDSDGNSPIESPRAVMVENFAGQKHCGQQKAVGLL